MQEELHALFAEYNQLLAGLVFDENSLDDSILEHHLPMLQRLSQTGNVGITVFDMHSREHVFTSYNFSDLFGYDLVEIEKQGSSYFNARIHPDDFLSLTRNGIAVMKFYLLLPPEECLQYKLINEYRMLNAEGNYIRVIEQHQVLEQDKKGNVWLALAVIDVSPNQDVSTGIRSQLLNFKTGKIFAVPFIDKNDRLKDPVQLTRREKEILSLVKDGLLSKEISDALSISVHTVNTHRQRILVKLVANNSMEAVSYASRLGLLE